MGHIKVSTKLWAVREIYTTPREAVSFARTLGESRRLLSSYRLTLRSSISASADRISSTEIAIEWV